MIGIENIGIWFPKTFESNYDLKERFELDDYFIKEKIGVEKIGRLQKNEHASDMCIGAFRNLESRCAIDLSEIDLVVVVTQNPDSNIPHVSALVHGKIGLPASCACFDVSLGCSGFVYGLSIVQSFLKENELRKALLFTADPYSKIIDPDDKNTRLLFGDGAAVTLIGPELVWQNGKFTFGTLGHLASDLTCINSILNMNGRGIFDFAARNVPIDVQRALELNGLKKEDIDVFIFHQGSKYIVDTLARKMGVPIGKVPFKAAAYGNTVSSSIPIILQEFLDNTSVNNILISGFGVGLSYASTILKRTK
jgi:3-oxoacyl-[acyl-carrier-protein] synthase III